MFWHKLREVKSSENNAAQGQSFTYLSNKRKCFAYQETSHTLDQCSIKERLVAGAQPFAHSTRQPFYMIQPSEEAVEKEKLYRHCLQITSDISNLDLRKVKVEVSKFWKLTDWEIRTKGRQNFLVSFNSEDDLISCLETPRIGTSIDDKEVSFTVARWKEEGEEHMDLIREWFLVYGVPRIYRNWKELYQIASAVGVLIDVDEESLEGDNKEPVKLQVGLKGVAGALFSCHFVFGWYSRWITFMIEDKVQNKDKDCNGEDHPDEFVKECKDKTSAVIEIPPEILNKGMNLESSSGDTSIVPSTCNHTSDVKGCSEKEHEKELETLEPTVVVEETNIIEELRVDTEIKSKDNISAPAPTTTNCEKKVEDNPRAEREQSTSGSSTSMVGDALFKGILAHQQVSLQKLDEEMNPESRNHTAETAASTGCNTLNSKSCLEKDGEKEMKMAETTPIVKGPKSAEEFGGDGADVEINVSSPAATVIQKTTEGSPKAEKEQSTSGNSTGMIGEAPFRGIQKPPIKIVYARRNKRSMEKQDSKCFIEKEHRKEMEAGLVGQGQKSDNESGGHKNSIDSNAIAPSANTINSKKKQTTKDIATTQGAQSISESSIGDTQTKGFGMAGTGTGGAQFDANQHISRMSKQEHNEIFKSFKEMGLQESLLKGIYAYDLDKPSAVHQRGIVPLCNGLDIIQQSLFETTVTLCSGVLQQLDYASTECQALVLVPTRDLAHETKKVIGALGQFLSVKAHAFCGGTSAREDQQILSSGVQVAVGTPCHVLGMLQGRALCQDHIRMFVLDEAEEVLRGFKDQIHDIIQLLPTKTQFGFFSATMSHEALEMCHKFMNKPVEIIVPRDEELKGINVKQFYVNVENEDCKLEKLCGLFDTMEITESIIVVNTRRQAKSLTEKIRGKRYTVSAIHGGMHQGARDKAIQEFQSGSCSILIATDLRGIDVLHAPATIIYDLPTQPVCYLRHVQRSGQHRRKGVAISYIARADEHVFSNIQKFCNAQIEELPSNVADLL